MAHAMSRRIGVAFGYRARLLPRVVLGGLPGGRDGMNTWEEPGR